MSRFTKTFTVTKEFDDDTITIVMERMKRTEALSLAPFFKEDANGNQMISFEDRPKMMDVMSEILPRCVKSFTGCKDEFGADMTFAEVLEEAYFISLVQEIINELFQHSYSSGVSSKKSEAPLPSTTPDTATEDNSLKLV